MSNAAFERALVGSKIWDSWDPERDHVLSNPERADLQVAIHLGRKLEDVQDIRSKRYYTCDLEQGGSAGITVLIVLYGDVELHARMPSVKRFTVATLNRDIREMVGEYGPFPCVRLSAILEDRDPAQ